MNSRASKVAAYMGIGKPKLAGIPSAAKKMGGLLSVADKVRLASGKKAKAATSTPLYKKRTTIAQGLRNFVAKMKTQKFRPFALKGTY